MALKEKDLNLSRFPRKISRVAFAIVAAAFIVPATSSFAQIPAGSSARNIQNDVEKSDPRVTQLIAKAEDHFRKGKLNLEDNKREQARDEFDRAVDSILESGMDVRASQRLQVFYLELVERIYREEVPTNRGTVQANVSELIAQNPTSTQQSDQI